MLDQIVSAFDRKDYKQASRLLKEFLRTEPTHPWGQFYRGRLYEVAGNVEGAKDVYQMVLRTVAHPKVALQARQGLQRLENAEKMQRQATIAEATADPKNVELGMLVLEPLPNDRKQAAAQAIADIMQLDLYTARLQIPNRGWKLYRIGAIGELQLYGQQFRDAHIPAFWSTVNAVQKPQVFHMRSIQEYSPHAIVQCENEQGQLGNLTFNWSEISHRVEGLLPIFERVVDISMREGIQRQRKEQTQDYAQICDLHLPSRQCILRVCDWKYDFHQGIEFGNSGEDTIALDQSINRLHWNSLRSFFAHVLPNTPVFSDFMNFAETAIDFPILLQRIPSNIQLLGQESSLWNPAFHLYSHLATVQSAK